MDLSVLSQLKTKLQTASKFHDVVNFFFDIAEKPGFLDVGSRVTDPVLEQMVNLCTQTVLKKDVGVQQFLPVNIPEYQFTHGGGSINGLPMTVIYFDDIDKGVVAILKGDGQSFCVRFTKKELLANDVEMN